MRARTLTLLTCAAVFGTPSFAQIPTLLKDINPGAGGSSPIFLTCFGGVVYFNATDGAHGAELWKSDGTEAGTVMVKDLVPGSGSAQPKDFMQLNGVIHFSATDPANGVQLWRTDGTESGTQVVLSLADVPGLIEWMDFVVLDDRIFFRGRDAVAGSELWSTDGTAAGTQLFLDIDPGPVNSSIQDPMVHDGMLYFRAADGTNGPEPWICDGTVAGTHMIADVLPGSAGADPADFIAAAGLVFFRASLPSTGAELFATDGTAAGTYMVKDFRPGPNSGLPAYMAEHNGLLYCRAYDPLDNFISQSDGTTAGTIALPEPIDGYDEAQYLCSHDGWLYFTAVGTGYRQLWRTNGTAEGAAEILYPGNDVLTALSGFVPMVSCGGGLFYRANYMAATGQELYTLGLSTGSQEHAADITQLYPNPVTDRMVVHLARPTNANLLDNSGRVVLAWKLTGGSNTIDLAGLASGAYTMVTDARAYRIMKQ